uniref:Semaphorin 3E n=1 Tax=Naja naja TaxID=35670 RepID=A0A8C6XMX2_NAJNA
RRVLERAMFLSLWGSAGFLHWSELWDKNRTSVFHSPSGSLGLRVMLVDEYQDRLFLGGKNLIYSLSLDRVSENYREIHWPSSSQQVEECTIKGRSMEECANHVCALHRYNRTHLLACGTGAFDPLCAFVRAGHQSEDHLFHLEAHRLEKGRGRCPYAPSSSFMSTLYGSELFTGLYSDYWGRDAAIFRLMGRLAHIRTEPDDERLLKEPKFVSSHVIPDNEDREDNKVYFFFTEKALEAEAAAQALYARVGRVCVNDMGGQRMLVNKWTTFLKARLACSVPGMNGIDTHFDELEDIFLLQTRDNKNPVIFGLFNTTSNIFHGYAVCVYHMASIRAAFNGPYAHKEGPEYHWSVYEGKVPYPRPGSCASKVNGGIHGSTKDYPDEAIRFARGHPLMYQTVRPVHKRPILVKTDGKYGLKQIAVDRVEAEDGQYDVLFIGTDNGIVLKVITIYNQDTESMEEVILEELQVFKVPSPILFMEISSKRQQIYVGSESAVAQVKFHQCDMYGSACADCCLARDPYCAWDGISCSRYYPTGTQAKRRFRRQDVRHGNAAQQCFGQQLLGDASGKAEERLVYGIEHNSTLLECIPRTLQAQVIWLVQRAHEARKEEVLAVACFRGCAGCLVSKGNVRLGEQAYEMQGAPVSRPLPEGSCWEIQQLQVFPTGAVPGLLHESPSHLKQNLSHTPHSSCASPPHVQVLLRKTYAHARAHTHTHQALLLFHEIRLGKKHCVRSISPTEFVITPFTLPLIFLPK